MFIKVKGERDDEVLVNADQIKFIINASNGKDTFIDFGDGVYLRSKTSIDELEQMIEAETLSHIRIPLDSFIDEEESEDNKWTISKR